MKNNLESKLILPTSDKVTPKYDEALLSLSSVQKNLKDLIGDLVQPPESFNLTPDLNRLDQGIKALRSNIELISGPFIDSKKKEMANVLEELETMRIKYKNLQREWNLQQEHMGRIQGEVVRLKAQIRGQSDFCSTMGSVLGSLMWKATRMASVVDILLSTNRVGDLLQIVANSLESFLDTYRLTMPDTTSLEMQFVISHVGIIANVAAHQDGRNFLVTDGNGKQLIKLMMDSLLSIPEPSGDCLKKLVLLSLYNISINQTGLIMLFEKPHLLGEIAKNIVSENNPELRLLALRLLQSLTLSIPSPALYEDIVHSVPMDKVKELTNTTDAEMRLLAKSIVIAMEKAEEKFGSKAEQPRYDACHRTPDNHNRFSTCSLLSST